MNQWRAGRFKLLPQTVLLSSTDINGALGAYGIGTGTIYLNVNWLETASKKQVFSVLTEELGHHLDKLLNSVDTSGDEGEYLSRLLSGPSISDPEDQMLREQSDAGIAIVNRQNTQVEQAGIPIVRGNSLYLVVEGPSWTEAEAGAASLGGHLVTINNAAENAFLVAQSLLGSWIGLTDHV